MTALNFGISTNNDELDEKLDKKFDEEIDEIWTASGEIRTAGSGWQDPEGGIWMAGSGWPDPDCGIRTARS